MTVKASDLGRTATDKITGLSGVITGYAIYLTGCNQAVIVPPLGADGRTREAAWFDVQRLELTDAAAIVLDNGQTPGCDTPAPPAR